MTRADCPTATVPLPQFPLPPSGQTWTVTLRLQVLVTVITITKAPWLTPPTLRAVTGEQDGRQVSWAAAVPAQAIETATAALTTNELDVPAAVLGLVSLTVSVVVSAFLSVIGAGATPLEKVTVGGYVGDEPPGALPGPENETV